MIVKVPAGVAGGGGGGEVALKVLPELPQPMAKITEQKRIAVTTPLQARRLTLTLPSSIQRFFMALTEIKASARSRSTPRLSG